MEEKVISIINTFNKMQAPIEMLTFFARDIEIAEKHENIPSRLYTNRRNELNMFFGNDSNSLQFIGKLDNGSKARLWALHLSNGDFRLIVRNPSETQTTALFESFSQLDTASLIPFVDKAESLTLGNHRWIVI